MLQTFRFTTSRVRFRESYQHFFSTTRRNTLSLAKQMATNYKNIRICKSIPHPTSMQWDYKDKLKEVTLNASGERVRKVIEKTGGIIEERIYLGGYEIYRKTISGTLDFERETLHISDDQKKIASIETKTVENGSVISSPVSNIRY